VAQEFRLPDIGEGLIEAEVVEWLVGIGDPVGVDQPIVELETDKAVTDISSPYAGVLLHQGGEVGSTIEVGQILVVIGYEGEEWTPGDVDGPSVEAAPIVGTLSEQAVLLGRPDKAGIAAGDRPKALPLVRKLANEYGIRLKDLRGTGPNGRITREDVVAAAEVSDVAPDEQFDDKPPQSPMVSTGDEQRVRMSRLRRTISDRMVRSWSEIPHVTAFDSADAGRLLAARKALARRGDVAMPLEVLIVGAVVPVLREFPEFNAAVDGDELVLKKTLNIGVAVDTEEGLIVPVLRDAGAASVAGLAAEIVRLATAARARTLAPVDVTGATFTISNIGAVGGGFGTPIVPYGTTAILSVGRAEDQAVARGGEVVVAPMMPLSLSYDHRAIDGALGRRFLAMVVENLEEPALFLAE
jgi:pyruvate dehydrogenase E2 component (dihydrolipoamide acetyltransferase)